MTAVIVLGKRLGDSGALPRILEKRVTSGVKCAMAHNAGIIIFSGGFTNANTTKSEAAAMKEYAGSSTAGKNILLDERSHDTAENALFATKMAAQEGAAEIIVCTSFWHLIRCYCNPYLLFKSECKKYGIKLKTKAA